MVSHFGSSGVFTFRLSLTTTVFWERPNQTDTPSLVHCTTVPFSQPVPMRTRTTWFLLKERMGCGACCIHSEAFIADGLALNSPSELNLPIAVEVLLPENHSPGMVVSPNFFGAFPVHRLCFCHIRPEENDELAASWVFCLTRLFLGPALVLSLLALPAGSALLSVANHGFQQCLRDISRRKCLGISPSTAATTEITFGTLRLSLPVSRTQRSSSSL